jgi:response regulator RpfG family c-di-GMP phosphodiesterase
MSGNILVVDDDPKVLEILEKTLKNKGHDVHVARDAEEALGRYKIRIPDMVILDIVLPDMDGRDLLKIMRSVPGVNDVPALFVSASSDPETMVNALSCGADDFLVKPFSLQEFNAKVHKVLGSYESTRALAERAEELESEVSEKKASNKQINRELKRQLLAMRTLFDISQDLNRRLDLDEMINGFSLTLVGELQLSSLALFTTRRERDDCFYLQGLKGIDRDRMKDLTLKTDSKFAEWVISNPRPQKLVGRENEEQLGILPDRRLAVFEYVSPIVVKQELKGIVFVGPRLSEKEFTSSELDMLRSMCNSAGIGLDNARLFRELQNTYLSTVKALVSIIEAKDPYTKGHTERVADYTIALGRKMGLPKDAIRDLAFGAVLHDIGKLVVYERVLNKPGRLSEDEWASLKEHPSIGASIIENMDFLMGTVDLVRHHHEAYDGTGYPDGLAGEQIPLGARIISVADSYDAMTTDRSYRKALSSTVALDSLKAKAGSQYDSEVVKYFVELIEVDRFVPHKRRDYVVTADL